MASRTSSAAHRPTAAPSIPRPPLSVHPAATISETAYFQGTHPISIGAGTVVHPRAKLLSFRGPVSIGEGCIIGEKSIIGGPVASNSGPSTHSSPSASAVPAPPDFGSDLPSTFSGSPEKVVTIIENSVSIGPLATISAGSHVHSAAAIESSAFLGNGVNVGRHAKVCASCSIPEGDAIEDWTVVWVTGSASVGNKLQRRKRAAGASEDRGNPSGLSGGLVETGRLVALNRERESLTKLIGIGGGKRR